MKTLIATLSLAGLVAGTALAQTRDSAPKMDTAQKDIPAKKGSAPKDPKPAPSGSTGSGGGM